MSIKVQIIGETRLLDLITMGPFEVFVSTEIGSQSLAYTVGKKVDVILLQHHDEHDFIREFVGALLAELPECKIILIGQGLSDEKLFDYIVCGCIGYLDCTVLEQFLIKAIAAVYNGEAWISRKMVAHLIGVLRG